MGQCCKCFRGAQAEPSTDEESLVPQNAGENQNPQSDADENTAAPLNADGAQAGDPHVPSSDAEIEAGLSNAAGIHQAAEPSNAVGAQAGPSNAAGIHQAGNIAGEISLIKILQGTDEFKEQIREGWTSNVYRGTIDNQLVAVKRLKPEARLTGDYEREVKMLTRLSHPNIINLIGFCAHDAPDRIERIIVYEYMPLRSLHYWLYDRQAGEGALDWVTRMRIGAGVAKALSYLHAGAVSPVVFGDLKPADVLLGQGYHPKISDFGAGALGEGSFSPDDIRKGSPYTAPEVRLHGKFSPKTDVFNFGMLMQEIVTRIFGLDKKLTPAEVKDPTKFVEQADEELEGQFEDDHVVKVRTLALMCTHGDVDARPDMSEVVEGMNYLAGEPGATWPMDFIVAVA